MCDVILRSVLANMGGVAVLGRVLKVAILHGYGKTPPLVENVANLVGARKYFTDHKYRTE